MGIARTLHIRRKVLSLRVLTPGRVTASLTGCGSKDLDTEQGGSELLALGLTFPHSSSLLSPVYTGGSQAGYISTMYMSILQVYKITSICEGNLLFSLSIEFSSYACFDEWAQK